MSSYSLQYADTKRFLASAGVIILALSVIIPWLVLKEPFEMHTKATDVADFTAIGQFNIQLHQIISLVLMGLSCCVSPFLFLVGVIMLVGSMTMWYQSEWREEALKKHKTQGDVEQQQLEIKLRRLEVKQKEIESTFGLKADLGSSFRTKLRESFSNAGWEVQIKNNEYYDYECRSTDETKRTIFIRLIQTQLQMGVFEYLKAFRLKNKIEVGLEQTHTVGVILFISKSDFNRNRLISLIGWLKRNNNVRFLYISDADIKDLSNNDFLRWFTSRDAVTQVPHQESTSLEKTITEIDQNNKDH